MFLLLLKLVSVHSAHSARGLVEPNSSLS